MTDKTKLEVAQDAILNKTTAIEDDDFVDEDVVAEEEEATASLTTTIDWDALPKTDSLKMYMYQISKYPLLSAKEEETVIRQMQAGDEAAREKLICSNLRLVINLAKEKMGRGVDFDDLIQEGNAGLITAADKFDAGKGFRFSTYATCWINESLNSCLINAGRSVRLPTHVVNEMNFVKKAQAELAGALCRDARDDEVARYLDGKFDNGKLAEILELIRGGGTVSLDRFIDDDDKTTVADMIPATGEDVAESCYTKDRNAAVRVVLEDFKPMYRRVMELRYGLGVDGEEHTLDETSKILYAEGFKAKSGDKPISKERIRQIESLVIKQIRESKEKREALEAAMC